MSRAARLAELKALRASGKKRLATYEVQQEERLYEEVDEESYKKVVRGRLDRDDFVIDDNGEGYADDGREEWMGERGYESASEGEEQRPLKGKAGERLTTKFLINSPADHVISVAKRKREEEKEKFEKTNNSINKYFNNGPVVAISKPKVQGHAEDARHC